MSNRRKGRRTERHGENAYREAGFETYRPQNAAYGDNDMFNLFDMAAFHEDAGQLRLVQFKTNTASGVTAFFNDASAFERCIDGVYVDFAVRVDREGWRLFRPHFDAGPPYVCVFDGRDADQGIGAPFADHIKGFVEP